MPAKIRKWDDVATRRDDDVEKIKNEFSLFLPSPPPAHIFHFIYLFCTKSYEYEKKGFK